MSVVYTLLALAAFVVLTLGTAVFVAAEFSLTALERSTVDANARTGGRRDHLIQRAHKTLSFQLSGAQVGISVTTLITGYLAEPLIARLLEPAFAAMSLSKGVSGGLALGLSLLIATSVSMVFGELVAQYLAVARPLETARVVAGPAGAVLDVFHPGDQADQRRSQLDPAAAGYRARRGTTVGPLAAGTRLAGPQLRASRRAGSDHGRPCGPLAAVRIANRRRTDDAPLQDRGPAGRPERRRPGRDGDGDRLLALPDRGGRPRRDRRPRARQTGLRGRARRPAPHHARRAGIACPRGALDARRRRRDGPGAGKCPADRAGGRRVRRAPQAW